MKNYKKKITIKKFNKNTHNNKRTINKKRNKANKRVRRSVTKRGGEKQSPFVENKDIFDETYTSFRMLREYTYLNDVTFNIQSNENDALKNLIFKKSFYNDDKYYFENLLENLSKIIPSNINEWVNCKDECYNYCNKMVSVEINSTAYILKLLTNSVIGDTKNNKITFDVLNYNLDYLVKNLTGKWKDDYIFFNINIINEEIMKNEETLKNGRLIMGFGPSASGKTYSANKIIELMNLVEQNFPRFFISIDGGIYREQSMIYQSIVNTCKNNGINGLNNLVSANIFTNMKTIFDSNIIKKLIRDYLIFQKTQQGVVINLYVPETIGVCLDCYSKYSDYVKITGDNNWIGVMIYQHKTHDECIYKDEYKCKGTTESGTEREITEGKKYSSSAWDISYKNGNKQILNAPNYRFRIHNSGRRGYKSIFEDLSVRKILNNNENNKEIINFFYNNVSWEYIDGKVKNNSDCLQYIDEKNKSYCNKYAL